MSFDSSFSNGDNDLLTALAVVATVVVLVFLNERFCSNLVNHPIPSGFYAASTTSSPAVNPMSVGSAADAEHQCQATES
jgi:hypothetical protein